MDIIDYYVKNVIKSNQCSTTWRLNPNYEIHSEDSYNRMLSLWREKHKNRKKHQKQTENGIKTRTVWFSLDLDNVEISSGFLEEAGELEQPPGSLEQDELRKNGKYNLRKSLTWDNAFFASAGFLEPEELSSMLGGSEKGEISRFHGIQEDVNRSFDSLTMLDTKILTLENSDADLFEDIRASIQKFNKISNTANSIGKKELETTYSESVSFSKKVAFITQDKMKQKAAPKRPNIGVKDTGKTMKQPLSKSGESTSSLHKLPMGLSQFAPISTTSTRRLSLDAKIVKMEKNAKSVTGRGTTVSKTRGLGGSRHIVPKSTLSTKSSSCFPDSSTAELRNYCTLLESSASVLSEGIGKSSLNLTKQKNDSRKVNPSSSGYTISNPSKIVAKGKNQAGNSKLSTFLKSSTKLSSSISPASSISVQSSESLSSTSAANQRPKIVRDRLRIGSHKGLTTNCDVHQDLDSPNHPTGQCLLEAGAEVTGALDERVNKASEETSGLLHPASVKPSSLQLPSPKIGFFDGVRSSGRSPNGNMLYHPGGTSDSPNIEAKSTSPSGSSNSAMIGKFQPVRILTAIKGPKVDVKQTSSLVRSRSSSSIQKPSNAPTKVPSASRNLKSSPGTSPKLQNKSSSRTDRGSYSKAQGIGSVETVVSQIVGVGGKDGARIKDAKIVPLDGVPQTADNLTSESDVQHIVTLKEAAEKETYSQSYFKTNTLSLYNTTKEDAPLEDQITGFVANGGPVEVDINSGTRKEAISDYHFAHG
ncbi:hypothetical protein GOBAR_AA23226 [Gossypium barbadense]|uniref:Uncharacterized protein n=1 Tax=Gossypium barbadense TaxID=3634 RepID=A0A2P5X289_GOSBA|nr:hypothetical protein GOBAR_AA23226 [Gossypium barbadense]